MDNEDSVEVEVIGPRSSLVALSKALGDTPSELKVIQPEERAYGEPGTVFLLIAAGSAAMPAIIAWIYRNKEGIDYEQIDELVEADGTTRRRRVRLRFRKSAPPSPAQIEQIAKMAKVDPAKILEAIQKAS